MMLACIAYRSHILIGEQPAHMILVLVTSPSTAVHSILVVDARITGSTVPVPWRLIRADTSSKFY